MISDKFKLNFNFISNILILMVLFLGGFVWADTNGIWHRAEDIQGGTFGSDELPVTTYFRFLNVVQFDSQLVSFGVVNLTNNTYYKNVELDNRYINENQTNSITSSMIVDGSINSNDVNTSQIATKMYVDSTSLTNVSCPFNSYVLGYNSTGGIICESLYFTYSWSSSAWSTCSATCAGGTQTRTVSCIRNDGKTVPDNYCPLATKPILSQSCNTHSCFGTTFLGRTTSFSHYMKHDASSDADGTSYANCRGEVGRIVCDTYYQEHYGSIMYSTSQILNSSQTSSAYGYVSIWISGSTVYVRHATAYNNYVDTWT